MAPESKLVIIFTEGFVLCETLFSFESTHESNAIDNKFLITINDKYL